jgi:hypothetical protein
MIQPATRPRFEHETVRTQNRAANLSDPSLWSRMCCQILRNTGCAEIKGDCVHFFKWPAATSNLLCLSLIPSGPNLDAHHTSDHSDGRWTPVPWVTQFENSCAIVEKGFKKRKAQAVPATIYTNRLSFLLSSFLLFVKRLTENINQYAQDSVLCLMFVTCSHTDPANLAVVAPDVQQSRW